MTPRCDPALYPAMRVVDAMTQREWSLANALEAPHGQIAVGAAGFDHVLRATTGDAYLRALRRGVSPAEAREAAAVEMAEAVAKHNAKRPRDICWQRAATSEQSYLDRIHSIVVQRGEP